MESKPRKLSRVHKAYERSVYCGSDALVQFALLSHGVLVTVKAGSGDVGGRADVDEVDASDEWCSFF